MVTAAQTGAFHGRLNEAAVVNDSLLCVGLDPDPARFPAQLRDSEDLASAIVAFNAAIIRATSDLVCAYKPNLAFYLAHGAAGIAALQETRRRVPAEIPVILDAKFGDIGNTAAAYAAATFDTLACDAVTVNPYLGEDALEPFLRRAGAGVIVLCKTSNRGSGDLQDLRLAGNGESLYRTVADRVAVWSARWPADLALVVGATFPADLTAVRERCPELPILLPGVGAQEGDLQGAVSAGLDAHGLGLIVSASRSVIYATGDGAGADWTAPVRRAALALREEINSARNRVVDRPSRRQQVAG